MEKVTAESYTLRREDGQWLGQVVITSDGMFGSVTDWGNFSFAWRSIGTRTFKEFLCQLNIGYFGSKMYQGINYIASTRKVEHACDKFAVEILPALQKVLRAELALENNEENSNNNQQPLQATPSAAAKAH